MSLTRDDVLRELELLPVWRLRTVSPEAAPATETDTAKTKNLETQTPQPALRMILSEDSSILFLLEALKAQEEETLLQNILKAMVNNGMTKPRVDIGLQSVSDVNAHQAKIIIAMGEAAANAIGLNADTQGQVQHTNFGAAIATFSPAHLLVNTADKAHAWQDLCLALQAVQGLQSV